MGIPWSPYSSDFGDPVVIIGIKCKMSEYKVAKSGGESISLKEIENGRSREKLRATTLGER